MPHSAPLLHVAATNANTEMHRISWSSRLQICPTFQVPCPSPNPSPEFAFVCWTCPLAGPRLGTGIPCCLCCCCCWGAEEANFGTWIDVVAALAKIRIKFMHFCCSVLLACLASVPSRAEQFARCWWWWWWWWHWRRHPALPCSAAWPLPLVHFACIRLRFAAFAWNLARHRRMLQSQEKSAKGKQTHTHTHTLTFAHEQTKRFAQFWLWFCN